MLLRHCNHHRDGVEPEVDDDDYVFGVMVIKNESKSYRYLFYTCWNRELRRKNTLISHATKLELRHHQWLNICKNLVSGKTRQSSKALREPVIAYTVWAAHSIRLVGFVGCNNHRQVSFFVWVLRNFAIFSTWPAYVFRLMGGCGLRTYCTCVVRFLQLWRSNKQTKNYLTLNYILTNQS